VTATDPVLVLPSLGEDLARVELRLRAEVRSDLDFLSTVARHLIDAGGKRIRPGLAIASAGIADRRGRSCSDDVVAGAVAVELVHMGSLYHDDVIDGATTRRNVASVNATWGNATAILAGDFLLARASQMAASLGTEVAELLAATIGKLCEGQIREYQDSYNCDRTVQDYELSIGGKTASLLPASCRVGAIVAELPAALTEALSEFGHSYGMAFQIIDDILDVISSDDELGKPAGHDLPAADSAMVESVARDRHRRDSGHERISEGDDRRGAVPPPFREARNSGPYVMSTRAGRRRPAATRRRGRRSSRRGGTPATGRPRGLRRRSTLSPPSRVSRCVLCRRRERAPRPCRLLRE